MINALSADRPKWRKFINTNNHHYAICQVSSGFCEPPDSVIRSMLFRKKSVTG
jgi:hypothetical protein